MQNSYLKRGGAKFQLCRTTFTISPGNKRGVFYSGIIYSLVEQTCPLKCDPLLSIIPMNVNVCPRRLKFSSSFLHLKSTAQPFFSLNPERNLTPLPIRSMKDNSFSQNLSGRKSISIARSSFEHHKTSNAVFSHT